MTVTHKLRSPLLVGTNRSINITISRQTAESILMNYIMEIHEDLGKGHKLLFVAKKLVRYAKHKISVTNGILPWRNHEQKLHTKYKGTKAKGNGTILQK